MKKTIGVVLLADGTAVEGGPERLAQESFTFPWVLMQDNPEFWPLPMRTAIARDASPDALLDGEADAVAGVSDAISRLDDGGSLMILGNCGFMWSPTDDTAATHTPTITSGLALLDLALKMTVEPVGILTYDAPSLAPMIARRLHADRLRIVGMSDMPDWAAVRPVDYRTRGGWTTEGMQAQLSARVEEELRPGGLLADVKMLVLECTWLPGYRGAIRRVTDLPMLDMVTFASGALR